jgi:hypothetical protein
MFCNSFEVGHSKEAVCLIFKFQSPDGNIVETAYVAISPSGVKTLIEQLAAEMKDYEKEHGQVETWKIAGNPDSNSQSENANKYRI